MANDVGEQLWQSSIRAGAESGTKFHCVGDGASWITNQLDLRFGPSAIYLIDFFHLFEYVSTAAETAAGENKEAWIEEKKNWLKNNRWSNVLISLQPFIKMKAFRTSILPFALVIATFRIALGSWITRAH
jgi:hypothetical protein